MRHFEVSKLREPKIHIIYFFCILAWQLIFYGITILLYPHVFSFNSVMISSLGNPLEYQPFNTFGYILFNFGIFISGFLFLGHYVYLYQKMIFRIQFLKVIVFIFLGLGVLGYWGISIITDNLQPYHDYIASFAFFGFNFGYQSLNYYWIVNSIRNKQHHSSFKSKLLLFMNIVGLLFMSFCVTYFLINYGLENYIGLALWEWLALFSIGSNMVITFMILQFSDYSRTKIVDLAKPR